MKKYIFILFVLINSGLFSQEFITPVNTSVNYSLTKTKATADTLNLPFWVDFSASYQMNNFIDNFISLSTYQSNLPPSIGAAMFDAMDNSNNYYFSSYNQSLIADYLTSKPIDLALSPSNNIYFSFKYQPKGFLDAPEPEDSLVLQFYSPTTQKWLTVWSATNYTDASYKTVILPITNPDFLQKGFSFRFYNRISSSPITPDPSFSANCDFWFVDYIYLNKNRSVIDTSFADIAFQLPTTFKFDDYLNIPYSHYKTAANTINHSVSLNFRNNDKKIRQIDSLNILFNENSNLDNQKLFLGSYALIANNNSSIKRNNLNFSFPTNLSADSLVYTVKTVLKTDTYDSTCNNVIVQTKQLTNFYSYDDGTAENAYGLYGEGTMYAFVAQKFFSYKSDNLLGVEVYFNKAFNNSQPTYFQPVVWNNSSSATPDSVIYEASNAYELNFSKLNDFQTFIFDKPISISDTFYIGWRKISPQLENVGLDVNSTTNNYKYFLINNGEWNKSSINGVLMIRPIFGQFVAKSTNKSTFTVFPNPTADELNIPTADQNTLVQIFNTSGVLVYKQTSTSDITTIDVSNFQCGVYIVQKYSNNKVQTTKFLKK